MIANKEIQEYLAYRDKIGNRINLYKTIAKTYQIHTALYPGSHIDITPSLVISNVIYIDNFSKAIKFFQNIDSIKLYLTQNKQYEDECKIDFIGEDYTIDLKVDQVELIISQYAGFVGQATKKYLKKGGILLCNDSHGDATLARLDPDYEFIGVVNQDVIVNSNLEKYFILSRGRTIDLDKVRKTMKGLLYQLMAENYIFRKIT